MGIHSAQCRTVTTRHGATRKRRKRLKAYKKAIEKEPTVKRCMLTLDLEPFTS